MFSFLCSDTHIQSIRLCTSTSASYNPVSVIIYDYKISLFFKYPQPLHNLLRFRQHLFHLFRQCISQLICSHTNWCTDLHLNLRWKSNRSIYKSLLPDIKWYWFPINVKPPPISIKNNLILFTKQKTRTRRVLCCS